MSHVHDYHIVSYEVNHEKREITFFTFHPHYKKYCRVFFRNVAGYHFQGDAFSNIILAITEAKLAAFYESWHCFLKEELRMSGAYGEWVASQEQMAEYLDSSGKKIWEISSSMGLSGWVIAGRLDFYASEA